MAVDRVERMRKALRPGAAGGEELDEQERRVRMAAAIRQPEERSTPRRPGGQPAVRRRQESAAAARPEETVTTVGESLGRKARLAGAGAIRGAGAIASLPLSAADSLVDAATQRARTGPGPEPGSIYPQRIPQGVSEQLRQPPSEMGQAMRNKFEGPASAVAGGVTPQSMGERFASLAGEEAGAGIPAAFWIRRWAQARQALGKAGRFARGIAEESSPQLFRGEALSYTGAATGRLALENQGPGAETAGALVGDPLFRYGHRIPLATLNLLGTAGRHVVGATREMLRSVPEQEARFDALIAGLDTPEKFTKWVAVPKNAKLFEEAAIDIQRAAGKQVARDAAISYLDTLEGIARDFGVEPSDLSAGAITNNPGLRGVTDRAVADNPTLAAHLLGAHERGSAAVRRRMVEIGLPDQVDDFDAVTNYVGSRARQMRESLDAEMIAADEAAVARLGDQADPEAARAAREAVSVEYAQRLEASYDQMNTTVVRPLYDAVETEAALMANVRFGVSHSKGALAEVRGPLREAGIAKAPRRYFDIIEGWPDSGVTLADLRDMERTLTGEIGEAYGAKQANLARQLKVLRAGVKDDILNYEMVEAVDVPRGTPQPPGSAPPAALPSEDNAIGLAAERGPVEGGTIPPPGRPGRPALGTVGTARPRGEENVVGLAAERSRERLSEMLDRANAAHVRLGKEFYDPPATGSIIDAYRHQNPVPHSSQLELYLRPAGNGYPERVAALAARTADSTETRSNVVDYLVADAYERSVRMVQSKQTGQVSRRLDRKALDRWKRDNYAALREFPEVRRFADDADALVERARAVGASPIRTAAEAEARSLERFVADPQAFWSKIRSKGEAVANREIDQLVATVRASGDDEAWRGLRHSFWSSQVVEEFSRHGSEVGLPEVTISGVRRVLGEPQMRHAVTRLYGVEHVRNLDRMTKLEDAARLQRAIDESGSIPGRVTAAELQTPGQKVSQFASSSSLLAVIGGFKRRSIRFGIALLRFDSMLNEAQRAAITQEAVKNPPLLRELLIHKPTEPELSSVWKRLGANQPTLFPRAQWDEQRKQLREEEKRRRPPPPPPTAATNRGTLSYPSISYERPRNPALGNLQ